MEISIIINKLNTNTNYDNPTGCWLWMGYKDYKGYGHVRIGLKTYLVHRLSAHAFLKLDLDNVDIHALHKLECPNKNCWNWNHLYTGDNFDNQQDKKKLNNTLHGLPLINKEKTHCNNGHPLSGDNLYIAKDGRRRCKECRLNNARRFTEKQIAYRKRLKQEV